KNTESGHKKTALIQNLPGDIKKCKVDAEHMTQTLDLDLKEKKLKEQAIKYTHKEFHRAAIEWFVATDQSFKTHLKNLKVELNGPKVSGKISLTCDAWQAENTDGYFAVTGHWIEETAPMQWKLKSTLVGFTWLCNAHNGEQLGQALFKFID
ncbi:hypothetical protein C0989_004698, partial [Termitomyces sp. Mn162]